MSGVYIRSPLVRSLYWKAVENRIDTTDTSVWYECDLTRLPDHLQDFFFQCYQDPATEEFLENCHAKSDWIITQLAHVFFKVFLSIFMTKTSVNGVLGRGSMFVFSSQQFQDLMQIQDGWKAGKLLDLGAGDGMVTKFMEPYFEEIFATEMSPPMRWRLENRGYKVLEIDEWSDGSRQYDVISCLNLLDRCDKPLTILKDIRKSLVPDTGKLILAVVIPFKPYVEYESEDNWPSELLPVKGRYWEEQVTALIDNVFTPAGFTVLKFTRLPYLCEGDLHSPYYVLDDALFVLKVTDSSQSPIRTDCVLEL
ncbi:protein-L-histidine N-pros-methyltransferase-like isoform X2 [Ptychodera flava]|uniref:protein-L-histidine N-pros-methyltransferase-like isoform X2 n=1 Tax=Ptychodera flava TaxID=63121 RepID=UPI00396A2BC7